jgi:putative nucleotidyltransferase with HDIG domain
MDAQEALLLLELYVISPGLHAHCIGVGKVTNVIAYALQRSGQIVNVERATLMGLIHDLGREQASNERHSIEGYKLAREVGVSPEIARICITHMTVGRTADAAIAIGLFTEAEAHGLVRDGIDLAELNVEEQIVCLADSHVLNGEFVSLAERIAELESRKGSLTSEQWYNLNKIAESVRCFEQILNCPIKDLFCGKKLAEISFCS